MVIVSQSLKVICCPGPWNSVIQRIIRHPTQNLWFHSLGFPVFLRFVRTSTCVLCAESGEKKECAAFRGPLGEHYSAFTCITVVNRPYLQLNELNEYSAPALMWFERQVYVHSLWAVTQTWRVSVCEELGCSSLHLLLSPQLTPLYTGAKAPTDKALT